MSFYPILSAPGCIGHTTLFNFPPNNWEDKRRKARVVNLTWAHNDVWHSVVLGELAFGDTRVITGQEISVLVQDNVIPLLSLSAEPFPQLSKSLPASTQGTNMPNWRATLGLVSPLASTCYQGELDPFPVPGSLLTFAPLIQFGDRIENYVLLLNLEKNPQTRTTAVEIYNSAKPSCLLGRFEVRNNAVSTVSLDGLGLAPEDLPVVICRDMSAIPLYFSRTADNACLSLEHTHPPASYVIHGQRWMAQKILKDSWFKKLGQV